jgi:hypothetical protein
LKKKHQINENNAQKMSYKFRCSDKISAAVHKRKITAAEVHAKAIKQFVHQGKLKQKDTRQKNNSGAASLKLSAR